MIESRPKISNFCRPIVSQRPLIGLRKKSHPHPSLSHWTGERVPAGQVRAQIVTINHDHETYKVACRSRTTTLVNG